MTDTSTDMAVDTDNTAVEGLIGYIERAAKPSIARVHCIVSIKALAAERDTLRQQLSEARNSALHEAAATCKAEMHPAMPARTDTAECIESSILSLKT